MSEGGGSSAERDSYAQLLVVQDLDIELTQLEHRRANLDERADLARAEAALAALSARRDELNATRADLLTRQAQMEAAVATLTERREKVEERMYGARDSSARDLQAMQDEVLHLTQRRAEIEEQELEVMMEQEPIDAELDRIADERAQLESAADSLREALVVAEAVIQVEFTSVAQRRAAAVAQLPTALVDHYEALRIRMAGIAVARLVGNHCDGCHLELPSMEVDRIRHQPPGTVATCDQCGRILVRT